MIGLDGAGKTSVLKFLKMDTRSDTVPTVGLNIETVQYKELNLLVFDVGGKVKIFKCINIYFQVRSLWSHYYENVNAVIFVIDSTDSERMYTIKEELHRLN